MKVAIAGMSQVGKYLIEEFHAYGHELVVLTRSKKPDDKRFEQRETDYTVSSLVKVLEDVDALVSTITDYTNLQVSFDVHMSMLEALQQSSRCKMFIPSEWTLNVEDYPEQPMFAGDANRELHRRLKAATNIKWTIISNSWFADYILPNTHRHLRDIPGFWPMDHATKQFTIYGPGTQLVNFTPVRDVARATAALLTSPHPWDEYTYMSGDQMTWNQVFALVKNHDPEWTSVTKPLADTVNQLVHPSSPESVLWAYFELEGYSGALAFPEEKVLRHREKFFPGVRFRGLQEILDQAARDPNVVV